MKELLSIYQPIPKGKVVCHSLPVHAVHPRQAPGHFGFRSYICKPKERQMVPCNCGWYDRRPHFVFGTEPHPPIETWKDTEEAQGVHLYGLEERPN